jgi:hypothetical protein
LNFRAGFAVAVTKGAAANIKFKDGVMIFSQTKGGLMYEASVGGQNLSSGIVDPLQK